MRKIFLSLLVTVLLFGANAFAGNGDLIVDGKVGVGTGTESPNEKMTVNGVLSLAELSDHPVTTTGYGKLYVLSSGVQIDANDKLILHMDTSGGFRDSSCVKHSVTAVGSAQIASVDGRTGSNFDGSGDYLSIPDSDDWNFGSGDFTIDFWAYPTGSSSGNAYIISKDDATGISGVALGVNTTGRIRGWVNGSYLPVGTTDLRNAWHHVAVVKTGTNVKVFIDGAQESSASSVGSMTSGNRPLYIAAYRDSLGTMEQFFQGYIDELRISKGIARWTSNFTPTGPYGTRLYYKDSKGNVVPIGLGGVCN